MFWLGLGFFILLGILGGIPLILISMSIFILCKIFGFLGFILILIVWFVWSKTSKRGKWIPNKENQQTFFVCIFSMLSKMAKADGVIKESEISFISDFMNQINLDKETKKFAIDIFENAKNDSRTIFDYASEYSEMNVGNEMCLMIYSILWGLAYSDGLLHENEEDILKKLPAYLKISNSYFHSFKKDVFDDSSELSQSYEILESNIDDSDSEIKKKYKRLVVKYHPDKIQSKGLPKEFLEFANEQTQRINNAYHIIMKSRKKSK